MTDSRINLYIQGIFRNINDGQRSEIVLLQMTIPDDLQHQSWQWLAPELVSISNEYLETSMMAKDPKLFCYR
jgi:hypothetical protein